MSHLQQQQQPQQVAIDPAVQQAAEIAAQLVQQHLQQQGSNSSSSSSSSSPQLRGGDKPRLPPPPTYDGRTAGGVDGFLRELRKQFAWYAAAMQRDADRIRFGSSHLSGVALDWWESIAGNQPQDWKGFEEALRTRFQPVNSADAARALLDKLRHAPRQPVHEYTAEFRRILVALPKMDEGDRVYRFLCGLQPRLAGLVRLQAPTRLADAIAFAARVDGLTSSEVSSFPSSSSSPPGGSTEGGPSPSEPMDVNNIEEIEVSSMAGVASAIQALVAAQQQQGALLYALSAGRSTSSSSSSGGLRQPRSSSALVPNVTAGQIQDRRERGACFACGKEGHRKADCPANKQ